MAEQVILDSERHPWELVWETSNDTLFWRHRDSGTTFRYAPSPSADDDIARLQDTGGGGGGGGGGGASALSDLSIDVTKDWQSYSITNLSDLHLDGVRFKSGTGVFPFPCHHTEYSSGLSQREIARVTLRSSEFLEVYRLETKFRGGGTDPDFSVELYDATNSEVLASTSDRTATSQSDGNSRLAASGSGATVLLRVTNQTGTAQTASITGSAAYHWT